MDHDRGGDDVGRVPVHGHRALRAARRHQAGHVLHRRLALVELPAAGAPSDHHRGPEHPGQGC